MAHTPPPDVDAKRLLDLGWQLVIFGQYADAREYFLKAIQLDPNDARIYLALGHSYFDQRRPDLAAATRAFRRVIDLNPNWSEGHCYLGFVLEKRGQFREAADSFETAIRLAPEDPRPLIALGVCLTQLKDYTAAINRLREGIALKPHYAEASAHLFLAEALIENGQVEAACKEWRTILGMPSEYPDHEHPRKEAIQMLKKYEAKGR